jgi:4-amino-4-deoxy-L-arabinose transferase-like glycosyltransferase
VLGGWFLVELVTLDFSAGIVHPYYSSALGPGTAAMAGAGVVAIGALLRAPETRRALRGYVLAVLALAGTLVVQLVLIHREGDPLWWRIPLVLLCIGALVAIALVRRRAAWALAVAVGALLVAPMVFTFSVWLAPVSGTFPAAGPYSYAGHGGYGLTPTGMAADRALVTFLDSQGATTPYAILTESDDQASPLILLGVSASSEGGYNTTDPALSGDQLATLVSKGEARYLMVSGIYSNRGGNGASTAARLVCPEIPTSVWAGGITSTGDYVVDCRGKAAELRHPIATARAFLRAHHRVHYAL